MSSPWRISCRARDSSNKAAKFSWGAAGWLVVAVAMSNRCPIALSARHGRDGGSVGHSVAWGLPCFRSRATALFLPFVSCNASCSFFPEALDRSASYDCSSTGIALALAVRAQCPKPVQHEGDACFDRHVGRIQDDRVGGGSKRRCRAGAVTSVPFPDPPQKTGKC